MGKTSLATNIAYNSAQAYEEVRDALGGIKVANGAKVAFFSLEMSAEQLAMRILAERTEISSDRIRRGEISRDDDFSRLVAAAQELQTLTSSSTTRPVSPCRLCAPARGA
jgi:Replicative DNA helicase